MENLIATFLSIFVLSGYGMGILLIFGAGIFMIYTARKSVRQADASLSWPATTGRITDAHVSYFMRSRWAHVNYEYQVLGQFYTGTKIAFGFVEFYGTRGQAKNDLARYPLNSQVTVYYDPSNPAEAVLERKAGFAPTFMTALGVSFIVSGLCASCPLILLGLSVLGSALNGSE
jgi:hypothetical protein